MAMPARAAFPTNNFLKRVNCDLAHIHDVTSRPHTRGHQNKANQISMLANINASLYLLYTDAEQKFAAEGLR
jgi:hypothetical protein